MSEQNWGCLDKMSKVNFSPAETLQKRHIGGNVSVVREVIDSSESRQNYQNGEGFSDLSGYPVESRTHPRGYLSESPFRGQVHKSGTSSIRTAEH